MNETHSQRFEPAAEADDGAIDPRRAMWRRGSYEIAGDWIRSASVTLVDRVEQATAVPLAGSTVLDVATGTGAVAIEAARRGATVTGVDLTDELIEVAERRASEAGAAVTFAVGDFDVLDNAIGDATFDVVTSSFGVIFAPDATATATGLLDRLRPGGVLAVTAWDPEGVFMVPDAILELLPDRPTMPDMSAWATGIDGLFATLPASPIVQRVDTVDIGFDSASDCAEQLERWTGGWGQLFEVIDQAGNGERGRERFVEHLEQFAAPEAETTNPFSLRATYHSTVLRKA